MRVRNDLKLRKIGNKYVLVEIRDSHANLTDVFTLNATAACLWQRMCEGDFTDQELAEWVCERFEVNIDTALGDINRQLNEWKKYNLLVQDK